MYKPILVTTPRSGSSVVCHYLAQIGKQTANYQNNLSEYFDQAPWNNLHYRTFKHFGKNIIGLCTDKKIIALEQNNGKHTTKIDYKFNLLKNNEFAYMIKFIPYDLPIEITEWCFQNYTPVYLERKNKLAQLMSFMAMLTTKISHYEKVSTLKVTKIKFSMEMLKIFDKIQDQYSYIKSQFPGPVLFYEDLFNPHFSLESLLLRLNIKNSVNLNLIDLHITRNTIYESVALVDLIENLEEYEICKKQLDTLLQKWH